MSFALSAGVSGLQAHQKMLDISGNNLANVNTTAYKSSRITFSELLSQTVKKASQPTGTVGGTNPQQLGSGVGIASISPDMSQGNIVNTGNPLDLAMEGEGYFVLSDGSQNVYTRAGGFAVDANSNLIDPATGYNVQRIGSVGEAEGFQVSGNSNINVPYDVAMAANRTSVIKVAGNLGADAMLSTVQTNLLRSNITIEDTSGIAATGTTTFAELSGGTYSSAVITVSGFEHDGSTIAATDINIADDGSTTVDNFLTSLNTILGGANAVATIENGKIVVTDADSGYSRSDIKLAFSNSGTADVAMPRYFEVASVGGEEVKTLNIPIFDSQGGEHVFSAAFVRTNEENKWDMILTSITGDVESMDFDTRRIDGIEFSANDGSFVGMGIGEESLFKMRFTHDPVNEQSIDINMGTAGQLNGLTQFAGNSTAVAREQDGYEAGNLSTVSVNNEGVLIGAFSNGVKKNIATVQIALFQNTAGLETVGNGYYIPSANSGGAVATQAMTGGAGSIHGGTLEKSNADVASEFVNMIQAQNGFQANARTITVANEILRELTNLIR
ncbi:MAG: flagellar hook-basal body complex protein [Anaerohalosphaeraceae bacterium]|nr:flagellar hook-basal body complex protein [Anaerohalosphaeraceae bacterium]